VGKDERDRTSKAQEVSPQKDTGKISLNLSKSVREVEQTSPEKKKPVTKTQSF